MRAYLEEQRSILIRYNLSPLKQEIARDWWCDDVKRLYLLLALLHYFGGQVGVKVVGRKGLFHSS